MVKGVLYALAAFGLWFSIVFIMDFMNNKENLEDSSWVKTGIIGFLANFFDTLGIGSFAPLTAALRGTKQVADRVLPGTLNVSCTLPVIFEAFIFIKVVKVDAITLVGMLLAATVGAWVGAGVVSKLPEKKVQTAMGIALFITALLMLAGQMKWMPGGGEPLSEAFDGVKNGLIYKTMDVEGVMLGVPIGITGVKLIIGIIINFILGALMCAGIGLYAPCMALVYLLGMSPIVAFPIMMGSCAFLMPVASVKFVKEGAYNKKASMFIAVFGLAGVYIAANMVTNLPMDVLKWIVILVIFYTAGTLIKAAFKNPDTADKTI